MSQKEPTQANMSRKMNQKEPKGANNSQKETEKIRQKEQTRTNKSTNGQE